MKDLHIEAWPVERLRPYDRNLKNADKALPQMVDALRQWGFRIPLLVTGDGEIIDGKMRYQAAIDIRIDGACYHCRRSDPYTGEDVPAAGQSQCNLGGVG